MSVPPPTERAREAMLPWLADLRAQTDPAAYHERLLRDLWCALAAIGAIVGDTPQSDTIDRHEAVANSLFACVETQMIVLADALAAAERERVGLDDRVRTLEETLTGLQERDYKGRPYGPDEPCWCQNNGAPDGGHYDYCMEVRAVLAAGGDTKETG